MKATARRRRGKPESRYIELKQMLEERRREIQAEVQGKMRDVRAEGAWGGKTERSARRGRELRGRHPGDIEFALIQMKSETLNKINDALIAARAGRLRQLLRVRRGNRRKAAARAALRGPLQGLRGGPGDRRAARASARPPRRLVAVPRHVTSGVRDRGSAGGGARTPPHRPSHCNPHQLSSRRALSQRLASSTSPIERRSP